MCFTHGVRLNLREALSLLNSSYWFVPLVVTLAGLGLAVALLLLDGRVTPDPDGPLALLWPSSADGARALLSAIIGAMITAISITFSVTIVALTVAAQHFGPRVLNSFVRQTSAQLVLGTFMATFAYSVLALGSIRGAGPDADVPELMVSGSVVLVILSIGALIYYVHHVSTTLRIGELAAAIVRDYRDALTQTADRTADAASNVAEESPGAPEHAAAVITHESGYVQRIDYAAIARAAAPRGARVWIRREAGAFAVAGTALALVDPPEACDEELQRVVRRACILGTDRTFWHDPEFAVKQLVEIALRALSPGVNEPFTAVTCIDRLTEGLAFAAALAPPRAGWPDDQGVVRVYSQPQPFATLLRASFDPIRIFAGSNPAIYVRLLESLAELGFVVVREPDRELLREQADVIRRAAERALVDADDRAYVAARFVHCVRQLEGAPASSRR
ncbi:MAG TPA: DUF2254 domain-containing protein [Vicinamibacterales bacterium]|nr:DUF2254 domain-containing protein [Vicinamibacterales bacterium]